jgi:hypothetical protein
MHVVGDVHVPQLPPQPSSPQSLEEPQFGVQAIVVVVVEVVVVVVAPHVPKSGFAFPGGGVGFMQLRLQQLTFVAHLLTVGLAAVGTRVPSRAQDEHGARGEH